MAVLLVEPDREAAAAALAVIRWADSRWRVDMAEHGAEAWDKALRRRPSLVLCAPVLPDLSGAKLCTALRPRLRRTRFFAYAESAERLQERQAYDGVIKRPLERYAWISYLRQHRLLTTTFGEGQPPKTNDAGFESVTIIVGHAAEPEMKFGVPVPARSTVGMVLRQLGKAHIQTFRLLRAGLDLDADLGTPVERDDRLMLGATAAEPAVGVCQRWVEQYYTTQETVSQLALCRELKTICGVAVRIVGRLGLLDPAAVRQEFLDAWKRKQVNLAAGFQAAGGQILIRSSDSVTRDPSALRPDSTYKFVRLEGGAFEFWSFGDEHSPSHEKIAAGRRVTGAGLIMLLDREWRLLSSRAGSLGVQSDEVCLAALAALLQKAGLKRA